MTPTTTPTYAPSLTMPEVSPETLSRLKAMGFDFVPHPTLQIPPHHTSRLLRYEQKSGDRLWLVNATLKNLVRQTPLSSSQRISALVCHSNALYLSVDAAEAIAALPPQAVEAATAITLSAPFSAGR